MKGRASIYIIAGPQSSGKTTLWNLIRESKPDWNYIEELNPYLLRGNTHRGGAYVTNALELEITEKDMNETASLQADSMTHVIETGIFHLVYLEHYCGKDTADTYFPRYVSSYRRLDPCVVFIDTEPQNSWSRRKNTYEKRLDAAGVTDAYERKKSLARYRAFIENMYPVWLKYYELIPFRKIKISNSHGDYSRFLADTRALMQTVILP